ncbi:type VI secretion system protein TssL, short form [Pantoea sp. S18]|uniref:type VI secretion system protein TssL, short form n=1 Tax=Pantoea sp. S18 TaxID=3019892 RepID=UPI002B1FD172|nr:type VI secretion system protein TssL, short form [Pantoea sp. S18]MEA5102705.1 type VI secretion system protein TssL, short form [Pantoea sp. S18]
MTFSQHNITANTLDALMQDTWLLALAVRNGQSITIDDALYQRCFNMIQQVQDQLTTAGVPASLCEEIKFAHCVFLDELIMTIPETDISAWWKRTPLQGHFLGHLNGGEHFYERIKNLLHESAAAEAAVSCYYRMLIFGYAGKYRTEDIEERQSLMQQLKARLPQQIGAADSAVIIQHSKHKTSFWQRSPWLIRSSVLLAIIVATFIMNGHLQYLLVKG